MQRAFSDMTDRELVDLVQDGYSKLNAYSDAFARIPSPGYGMMEIQRAKAAQSELYYRSVKRLAGEGD